MVQMDSGKRPGKGKVINLRVINALDGGKQAELPDMEKGIC